MNFETILAADVGGTNTRLILYQINTSNPSFFEQLAVGRQTPGTQLLHRNYLNHEHETFLDAVQIFLHEANLNKPPVAACFAVAGPVKDNVVRFTNRASWTIDGDDVARQTSIQKVRLVNDFLANGYGLLTLNEKVECVVLQDGVKVPTAPIACIGAGTGLGECFLSPGSDGVYDCFPTEGGHAEFAPRNDLEMGLLNFLKHKFEQKHRVSVERVVSGPGLVSVYEYLCTVREGKADAQVASQIAEAGEMKGAVIAQSPQCPVCKETMELFVTAYGAEAGVAALKWLPYGGLYLTGGLTPKNIGLIQSGAFMQAFWDKGRVSGMLNSIPVFAVMVDNLGERGACLIAYKDLQQICTRVLKSMSSSVSETSVSAAPASCETAANNSCCKTMCSSGSECCNLSKHATFLAGIALGLTVAFVLLKKT